MYFEDFGWVNGDHILALLWFFFFFLKFLFMFVQRSQIVHFNHKYQFKTELNILSSLASYRWFFFFAEEYLMIYFFPPTLCHMSVLFTANWLYWSLEQQFSGLLWATKEAKVEQEQSVCRVSNCLFHPLLCRELFFDIQYTLMKIF